MRKQRFWRNLAIAKLGILLGAGGLATEVEASHFRYANMAWKPTGNPGEVEFNFQFGVARNSVGSPNIGDVVAVDTFYFGDGTTTTLYIKVTALDVAANWVVGELVTDPSNPVPVRKTYSGPGPFTAGFNSCCRLSGMGNRGDGNLLAQSIVTPFNGNSSPVSSMVPIVNLPASPNASFFVPAIDPDGDSLRWRIATDLEAVGSTGNTSPVGMTINPTTGQVTWDTSALDQTRFYTVQFMIEDVDLNGNVKTRSPVDVLLKIGAQTGTAPELEVHTDDPSNLHGPLTVVANTPAVLHVEAFDADPNNTLILNAGGLPAGAVVTPQLPLTGNTNLHAHLNWTPTLSQVGSHGITFSVTDETGLQTLSSMTINVISGATTAGNDSYSTAQDTPLIIQAPGVLVNDEDEGNNPLTAVLSSNPTHGTVDLQPDGSFVYTPESGYTGSDEFRYRAFNGSTYSLFATVSLEITSANAAPSDILLSNNSVVENEAAGTVIGALSAVDSDDGDTHTFTLVSGAGDTDNASFTLSNGSLQTTEVLDYEEKSSLSIRVRATDAGGATFEKQLTINVSDVVDGAVLFGEAQGIYMGLFTEEDEVRHASSGRFYVAITTLGTFSARAVVGGVTRRFSGKMGDTGIVTSTNRSGFVLSMTVDNSTATVTGSIGNSSFTSEVFAYKNLYSKANPSPFAGVYTLGLENGALTPGTPQGSAVLIMRVRANGRVGIGGFLADGLGARSASIISTNGQIPVYSSLAGRGSILGWLTLANDGNVSGDVSWIKLPSADLFPAGFTNTLTSVGSPLNAAGAFPSFTTGNSVFAGGDLLALLLNPTVDFERRFATYGRVSGTATHPTTLEGMLVRVVVLQNQNKAIGYWRTTGAAGSVTLQD